ncbi:MAG: hypothetical protein ACUVRS_11370 [Armatimonadota bacterium]
MNIRPGSTTGLSLAFAVGYFAEDESFVVTHLGGDSPFGSTLVSLNSEYAVHISPDGAGWSTFSGLDITSPLGNGKGWYIRDRESGYTWSPFLLPVGEKADEHYVSFLPGQVSAYTLKNKIAATINIATLPGKPVEVWLVRLENRSVRERNLTFTTYFEPCVGHVLETSYKSREKLLLMRSPLSSTSEFEDMGSVGDIVIFHGSVLTPVKLQTDKQLFIGDGRTLKNPREVDGDIQSAPQGAVENPVASFTVEIDIPIEGEAEFGFYAGVAKNPEEAIELAKGLSKTSLIREAIHMARMTWERAHCTVKLDSPDHTLNALVNTWLPYEAYAGWMRRRTGGVCMDPMLVADRIRRFYSICGNASEAARESLLSFAANISANGTYSSDDASFTSLPLSELIWLPLATARYIVETGDASILAETITKDANASSEAVLQDCCERILAFCSSHPEQAGPLFHKALHAWEDVTDTKLDAKVIHNSEPEGEPDQLVQQEHLALPRRIRHLLSLSQTLGTYELRDDFEQIFTAKGISESDCALACIAMSEIVEGLLGIQPCCDGFRLQPRLPDSWHDYEITRKFQGDIYRIHVKRSLRPARGNVTIYLDDKPLEGNLIPKFCDGQEHKVEIIFE